MNKETKCIVGQSKDTTWPKWFVLSEHNETEWVNTKAQALAKAHDRVGGPVWNHVVREDPFWVSVECASLSTPLAKSDVVM